MSAPLDDALAATFLPVERVHWETSDVFTCELDASSCGGFRFEPGQFNMLHGFGAGEAAISIAGDPSRPERLVHTIRRVGAVTSVLARLKRGDVLGVRGPFGRGWPLESARGKHLLIVAGGIGLAPLRPAILYALANPTAFASVSLLYGARTPDDMLYGRELERWAKHIGVAVTVDRAAAGWTGNIGVVTKLVRAALRAPLETRVLSCGPEIMMRFVARELTELGVPAANIVISGERSMKCGVGQCGHCQLGPFLLCRDGPALGWDRIGPWLPVREL